MGESRPPPYVICHLCGRKYGTKSIAIHVPQCQKKWHAENKKLPKNLRRLLPSQPDYGQLQSGEASADLIEQMNEMSFKAAQAQLIPCENCGRTFYPEKLPVHQRSCTADKPAKGPRRAAAPTRSKTPPRNPAKIKSNRQKTSSNSPPINNGYLNDNSNNINNYKDSNNNDKDINDYSNGNDTYRKPKNFSKILCVICMKKIPKEKIQTHLVNCNEEKIKTLSKSNSSDEITPDKIARPETRILRRKKKTSQKSSDSESTVTLTAGDKDGTYDVLKRSSSYVIEKSVVVDDDFFLCDLCNRKFTKDRITQHKVICSKLKTKGRKTFDSSKQRLQGLDLASPSLKKRQSINVPNKSDWRQKHQEFIQSIKAAKEVKAHMAKGGKASDIPPPPPSLNPDYVHCKYCDRRFNPEVAERHIPRCATTKNRPSPPKVKALDVYNKQENKSKGIKKSETFSVRRNSTEKISRLVKGSSTESFNDMNQNKQKRNRNNCTGYVSPRIEKRYDSFETQQDKMNNNYRPATSMSNLSDSETKNNLRKTSSRKNKVAYSYNNTKKKISPKSNNKFVF